MYAIILRSVKSYVSNTISRLVTDNRKDTCRSVRKRKQRAESADSNDVHLVCEENVMINAIVVPGAHFNKVITMMSHLCKNCIQFCSLGCSK